MVVQQQLQPQSRLRRSYGLAEHAVIRVRHHQAGPPYRAASGDLYVLNARAIPRGWPLDISPGVHALHGRTGLQAYPAREARLRRVDRPGKPVIPYGPATRLDPASYS